MQTIWLSEFQFHKGTIKTCVFSDTDNTIFYFNSIKVRLKHFNNHLPSLSLKFQFHKGTIKTMERVSEGYTREAISIP